MFQHSRRFITLDGTHLKARFIQTLLLTVGIDTNGGNILLAWEITESESTESWEWFNTLLRQCIPEIENGTMVISDRDKGLLNADHALGPHIFRAFCCVHIKRNMIKHGFSAKQLVQLFWRMAHGTC